LAAVESFTRLLRPTAPIAWSTRRNTAMSVAEIERFAADLKSNEALRAEADKAQAETSLATPMDRVVAFAATKGYAFTAADMKECAKTIPLTDAELVGVAGGAQIDFGLFTLNFGKTTSTS
jgi:predicted ribosomally synthesized peptide with nif11-like leader